MRDVWDIYLLWIEILLDIVDDFDNIIENVIWWENVE